MRIYLVFANWMDKDGKFICNTERAVELSMGDFHSGTQFRGEIKLDADDDAELRRALDNGFRPVLYVSGVR